MRKGTERGRWADSTPVRSDMSSRESANRRHKTHLVGDTKLGTNAAGRFPRGRGRKTQRSLLNCRRLNEKRVGAFRLSGCFQPVAWGHPLASLSEAGGDVLLQSASKPLPPHSPSSTKRHFGMHPRSLSCKSLASCAGLPATNKPPVISAFTSALTLGRPGGTSKKGRQPRRESLIGKTCRPRAGQHS